ncbi:poly-gamma-glutamate synthase PgsB [Streptomyces durbertensis]|uniref:poly-gamma-glutamate synthase PgsB n=1 Tax=Streptomyces durbertensis TaxID=2448886 RepID=UPI002B218041|nr:poly-gamma-glutamate synthase PgsB [Streptomyces durbertensis]
MLFLYSVLVVCCLVLLAAGVVEQRRHFANLDRIPTRVLVNGIRGKSSITRLCAGALRGGDLVTVAKTTGTAARFIHPDATEEPVYRKFGIANVVEQIGIVRRAAAYNPQVLVIECMAVMPALQEINQSKLIRSTIGVLCNVREDHLEEMGPTLDDVARSLSRSMPEGGICVTAESDRFHILQEEADARDCRLVYADPEMVTDEELRGFSWFTFKENVAIALTVAELLGVDRQTALQGMYDAPPDPGVLSVERYRTPEGKRLRFANVFAANDPESTLMNINQLLDLGAVRRPLNVVINCRPDRVERNGQMGAIIPELSPDTVFLIGHPTKSALDAMPAEWRPRAVDLGGDRRDAEEFMAELLDRLAPESSLVAIGNIHGQGEHLLEYLAELPADEEPDPDEDAPAGAPAGGAPAHGGDAYGGPTHGGPADVETTVQQAALAAPEAPVHHEPHADVRSQAGYPQHGGYDAHAGHREHADHGGSGHHGGQGGHSGHPGQGGHPGHGGQDAQDRPDHPGHGQPPAPRQPFQPYRDPYAPYPDIHDIRAAERSRPSWAVPPGQEPPQAGSPQAGGPRTGQAPEPGRVQSLGQAHQTGQFPQPRRPDQAQPPGRPPRHPAQQPEAPEQPEPRHSPGDHR